MTGDEQQESIGRYPFGRPADGADAEDRIAAWQTCVGWTDAWGLAGPAGGNGSCGGWWSTRS